MDTESSLARRFAVGSNDIAWFVPGTPHYEFFVAMPQRVRSVAETHKAMLRNFRTAYEAAVQTGRDDTLALREVRFQIQSIEERLETGFNEVGEAIVYLEVRPGVYMAEVQWILGQLNSRMADLIHLIRIPRQTEARELIEDGVKALAAGHPEDA